MKIETSVVEYKYTFGEVRGKNVLFLPHQLTVCFTETTGNTLSGKEKEAAECLKF